MLEINNWFPSVRPPTLHDDFYPFYLIPIAQLIYNSFSEWHGFQVKLGVFSSLYRKQEENVQE